MTVPGVSVPGSAGTGSEPVPVPVTVVPPEVGPRTGQVATVQRGPVARWLLVTKPGIIVLLLVTTVAGILATGQAVTAGVFAWTLVAGALCAASATTLNSWLDTEMDRVMLRTRRRPLAVGEVPPRGVLALGLVLGVSSVLAFAVFVNPLSAVLGLVAIVYYVAFYSLYLKRHTWHSVVIGGAAGAFPPLIGWVAVTGAIEPGGVFLFLIVFFWTPPHAWALTLLMEEDYRAAGVPMLPVALGAAETRRQILLSTVALVAITLLPGTLGIFGWFALVSAGVLGAWMLADAARLYRRGTEEAARALYRNSSLYLALLMLAIVLDRTVLLA